MSETLILPDTQLAKEARRIADAALSPGVLNHSLRTYLLGCAWGRRSRIDFDDEGFYVASLFHDFGMYREQRRDGLAFQLESGRILREHLIQAGVAAERISPLVDAVDFHMQPVPRWSYGPVAGLLQIGAWMDATWLRRWSIWSEAREIAKAVPRAGFDTEFPVKLITSLTSLKACIGLFLPGRYRTLRG